MAVTERPWAQNPQLGNGAGLTGNFSEDQAVHTNMLQLLVFLMSVLRGQVLALIFVT